MADTDAGAKKAETLTPPDSPQGKVDENGNPIQTPPEGANTSVGSKPFNETMKELMANPEFVDYIKRQNREDVQFGVQRELERLGVKGSPKEDEAEKLAQEFATETGVDLAQAKSFVKYAIKIAESKVKPIQETQVAHGQSQALMGRVHQVRAKYGDVEGVSNKMWDMFNKMDEFSQSFVLNSPDGVEWLYAKAKDGHIVATPQEKLAGGSFAGRGASPISKIGDETAIAQAASNALIGGKREEYEKYANSLLNKK